MDEPTPSSKYIVWIVSEDKYLWFDVIEEVTQIMNDHQLTPDDVVVYELAKEVKFKVVPE